MLTTLMASAMATAAPAGSSVQRIELENGYFLLSRPEGVGGPVRSADAGESGRPPHGPVPSAAAPPDVPFPLIVCLHGTDDSAEDMLRFWRSLEPKLPYMLAAPQGSRAGWREADLPLLREMLQYLQRHVLFDPERVLLTGHSAGGPMAFRLLYVEHFPATAVAVTANYVPPTLTVEQARSRADIPVFYAVGTRDVNEPRMRAGVSRLREAGVRITMRRPRLGHVLDRRVTQEALEWFEQVCRERVQDLLDQARDAKGPSGGAGALAAELEDILRCPQAQFADQVPQVRETLARLETSGRELLAQAAAAAAAHHYVEAHAIYVRVERQYGPASLGEVAAADRLRLELDPRASAELKMAAAAAQTERDAPALRLWGLVEQALARSDRSTAARCCRELLASYPQSSKADQARRLLQELETH